MSRQSILDKLTLNHETQIKKTLEDLEAQIISDIAEHKRLLSTQPFSPELLRQKTAITIQLRNDFKKQFQNIFLAESDSLIREYDQLVGEFMKEFGKLNIPDKFKNLTKVDLDTISALKTQTFQGFEEVANTYLTEINTNVYQNVIGGRSFDDMVRDISGKLTGAVDAAGRPMSSHAGQLAHDSIMQFDAQFVKAKASSAGLTHFRYAGTPITTTRDFCLRHIGQVYSEEEIRSIWSGSWTGKSSGDPFVVRGGYRCRHTWNPVDPDWFEKEEKKKEEKPIKNIFGDVADSEKNLLKEAFGNKVNPITKVISTIPALKKFKREGGGFYRSSEDLLNMGSNHADNIEQLRTFIHEYGHRIDRQLGAIYLKDKSLLKKYGKNTKQKIIDTNFQSISHLQIQSLIDDTKILTKDLKKRKDAFFLENKRVQMDAPDLVTKRVEREKFFKNLNLKEKVILSDDEIKDYLKFNKRSYGQEQIYKFKLKLKHKIFDSYGGQYDSQFTTAFNDYIGSITKETIGAGHGKYYYNQSPNIIKDGVRTFTHRQSLEAFANYTQMTYDLNTVTPVMNMNVRNIEKKLMEYYAKNTTNSFNNFIKEFDKL